MYTWGEIQIIAIQKMFLNSDIIDTSNLQTMKTDKKYRTYLNSMPQVANEGLIRLITEGRPLIKKYELTVELGEEDGDFIRYDLKTLISDFYKIKSAIYSDVNNTAYHIEGDYTFVISSEFVGKWDIYYEAYPTKITSATSDNLAMDIPKEMCVLLPLYIASELYKDDNIALATVYRNEFETGLNKLYDSGDHPVFISKTGWV